MTSAVIDWKRVARETEHPVRLALLKICAEHTDEFLSVNQLADLLPDDREGIAYHLRKLRERGLVEVRDTRPAGGVVEHYYGLTMA